MATVQSTVTCSECGKVYRGKIPKGGDGSALWPRRHTNDGRRNGKVCLGSFTEAEPFVNKR